MRPPIGIFNSVKDWIATKGSSLTNKVYIKEIYPETPVSSNMENRPPCPSSWYPSEFSGGYVAAIPNGRVWGKNGALITPDNYLLWDVSFEGVDITPKNHSIFHVKALPKVSYIENAADLTHVYSGNYYHWMYEVIPRIHLLKQSGLTINKYIVNEFKQPFQSETLYQLGLKIEQLLITNNAFHIQAENLIVPSQPSFPTKWGYDLLQKAFLGDAMQQSPNKKRIFITRKWSRKITNEDQVMEVLVKYGFVKLALESLSVAEQVKHFSSADVIIAAHGASLTNLTFCTPGTKVLEIFPPSYIIPHYWGVSSVANLDYHYFIGMKGARDSQMLNRWPGGDNITIDIPKFKAYLKKMNL